MLIRDKKVTPKKISKTFGRVGWKWVFMLFCNSYLIKRFNNDSEQVIVKPFFLLRKGNKFPILKKLKGFFFDSEQWITFSELLIFYVVSKNSLEGLPDKCEARILVNTGIYSWLVVKGNLSISN